MTTFSDSVEIKLEMTTDSFGSSFVATVFSASVEVATFSVDGVCSEAGTFSFTFVVRTEAAFGFGTTAVAFGVPFSVDVFKEETGLGILFFTGVPFSVEELRTLTTFSVEDGVVGVDFVGVVVGVLCFFVGGSATVSFGSAVVGRTFLFFVTGGGLICP